LGNMKIEQRSERKNLEKKNLESCNTVAFYHSLLSHSLHMTYEYYVVSQRSQPSDFNT
jgi:hypothetical protein